MEKHCVSLEIAKKLKESRWSKETKFWWILNKIRETWEIKYGLSECIKEHQESWEHYSAPLSSEILEELPDVSFDICARKDKWFVFFQDNTKGEKINLVRKGNNVCDVLAQIWLYLEKEGLINATD
jgi:hypothetical protein